MTQDILTVDRHCPIREARQNLWARYDWLRDRFFSSPDTRFDLVVTQDVLEHLFDPGAALQEIARTLRLGGAGCRERCSGVGRVFVQSVGNGALFLD